MASIDQNTPLEIINKFFELYDYNKSTGIILNKRNNKILDKLDKDGYIRHLEYRSNYERYVWKPHRFAYYYCTGIILKKNELIDHINGNRSDNRISNIRVVDYTKNMYNKKSSSSVGYKGVRKNGRFYQAYIHIGNRNISIWNFNDEIEAAKFYDAAARYYYGEFALCNFNEIFIEPNDISNLKILGKNQFRHFGKEVLQFKDGILINKFLTLEDAARSVNGFPSNIGACCQGRQKSYKSYTWKLN